MSVFALMGVLTANAESTPDKIAVIELGTGRTLTWAELVGRARATAARWRELGAQPTARVAVMVPNSLELIIAGVATACAQVQWVPINWHLKGDEVAYLLDDSGAAVLVATPEVAEHAEAAAKASQAAALDWDLADQSVAEPIGPEWDCPSWVYYTSGTTGRPKGVVQGKLMPERMAEVQRMLTAMWGFRPDDVHLLAGPGYHAGPGGYAFTTLFNGGTVAVLPRWDAELAWQGMAEHGVTTLFLTPAHMIRLLEVPNHPEPTSLRLIIHAGAPCPASVKTRFLAALPGVEVSELYGASEGGATKITRAEWEAHPGSVGTPWPGTTVSIRDEDGNEVPVGTTGTVWIQPPGQLRFHYHRDEAKTEKAWRDGAFTVGDIGRMDEDGYLYITDRGADVILWGGVNVYPREIEDVIFTHPAVVDCAVFGVPHERDGERIVAMVEPSPESELGPELAEAIRNHVRGQLADFKVPHTVELIQTLPRDPNGKVLKRHLRADYLAAAG